MFIHLINSFSLVFKGYDQISILLKKYKAQYLAYRSFHPSSKWKPNQILVKAIFKF